MCNSKRDSDDIPFVLKSDFFANTILMQCVMSAYDTIMQALLNQTATPYTLVNKLKSQGCMELQKAGVLSDDFICKNTSICDCNSASSEAAGFNKKLVTHKQVLDNSSFKNSLFTESNRAPFFQSDLIYRLMLIDARSFKNCLHLYDGSLSSEKRIIKNHKIFMAFYESLTENLSTNHVDRLYYIYRMEHHFSLGLADCISQNIIQLKKTDRPYPDGINDFKRLASISKLPNTFSRYLYLQYAFDAINNTEAQYDNYFFRLSNPDSVMNRFDPKPFSFSKWLDLFERFCHFFSNFIFPAFEWYFLLTLLETVENYPDTKEKSIGEQLKTLQNLLASYIEKNHEVIENPLHGEKKRSSPWISNYDDGHVIRPAYYKCHNVSTNSFHIQKDSELMPDIAEILTALRPFDTYKNLPIPEFDKSFCYTPNPENLDYKRFIGQITSFTSMI